MYAFIDTETGGLSTACSLLEVAAVVTDTDFNEVASFYVKTKPEDGDRSVYKVQVGALKVNQIDLVSHDKQAVTYATAGRQLNAWLYSQIAAYNLRYFVPAGWNIAFDERFIRAHLGEWVNWSDIFSYRPLDGQSVLKAFQIMSRMPNHLGSLASAANYFELPKQTHSALDDCRTTISVVKRMFNV